ncbi:hypothetical protein BH09DEP1_BH09DEP1_8110 [soil metagenome]
MKYYFCIMLGVSALNGMDAPMDHIGSPPGSPQWHSAPNSPEVRRYNREQLLAMSQCSLSSSMDSAIKAVKINTREVPHEAKPKQSTVLKNTSQDYHKRHAKK